MNQVIKKDVEDVVDPTKKGGEVEKPAPEGDDKEKNFAELRKQSEAKDAEIAELKRKLEEKEAGSDPFALGDLPAKEDKKGDDETLQKVFQRDMKEAILQFREAHKDLTTDQWANVKSKVKLKGDETLTEIKNAIKEAYQNLPEVRAKRDQELRDEGKKEAMKNHFDDEVSLPGGGDSGGEGNGEGHTRIPKETRGWGRKLGLTDKEIEAVDPDANSNEYTILDPAYKK